MNLQNFVGSVVEVMGGIFEPIEYALCEAIIPEEYKDIFQGKTELLLAFDFEVAEENPEAEFVTFGSYILDQLLDIVHTKTLNAIRYVIVDKLTLYNPEEKIKRFLGIDKGNINIVEELKVMSVFTLFNFIVGYTTEERTEEYNELWVDMTTNRISKEMQDNKSSIFYKENPSEIYPVNDFVPIQNAFETALEEVKKLANTRKDEYKDDLVLNREIKRIEEYYEELLKENVKKSKRKGVTEEKIKELESKEAALIIEKQRQLREITEKYSVTSDIILENGIIYFVPVIKYKINIEVSHNQQEKILYYNAITKGFTTQ